MLLVAARRPFDLGDRIYMTEPSLIITDGLWYSWFIEGMLLGVGLPCQEERQVARILTIF